MSPTDLLRTLRRRWITIVATVVLVMVGAGAASLLATPLYVSTSSLYFSLPYGSSANDLSQGSTYTQAQMQSYANLATSPAVLTPVIDELGLTGTPRQLAGRVSSTTSPDTVILQIQVTDRSPSQAARISNAVAAQLRVVTRDLAPQDSKGDPSVDVAVIGAAQAPASPSSPKTTRNLAAALVAGLGLGLGLALLREKFDNRLRDAAAVARVTQVPIIGTIERSRSFARSHLVVRDFARTPSAEAYRILRSSVDFLAVGRRPIRLVVTSSVPSEGKSTSAVNLAYACAEAGQRVLLVDADLRRASVAEYLGLEGAAGLTTVLAGRAEVDDVVQPIGLDVTLDVLTSGQLPPNPSELLGSEAMADLLDDLDERYDVVIFDAPPLLPVTDAAVLARLTLGAIVVAAAGTVRSHQLRHSMELLERSGAHALGVVLTRTPPTKASAYYGYVSEEEATTVPRLVARDMLAASRADDETPRLRSVAGRHS
ncbi:polysaccharide biosynthesis tyrosine autokinase [Solicola sp. PLA-1-18]|uniref:polysaccharide biosynthesis tyrosine autokinase n=1 Tax=Solicola sp. PLA-1-18 TaxID=3380532 RepID=UPI003B7E89FD